MNAAPSRENLQNNNLQGRESQEEPLMMTLTAEDYSLLTDLYQLTMAACYTGEGIEQRTASFELTVRRLPPGFGYFIAMGLVQALDYL